MQERHRRSAAEARSEIVRGAASPALFAGALAGVPPAERDAWLDLVLGLGEIPGDGPDLPRGCVPYLPCAAGTLLRVVERAPVQATDVFVDVGAGVGRAAVVVHLLTGAPAIGVEIQPPLARAARELVAGLGLTQVQFVEADAADIAPPSGTVYLLYCPFGGPRLERWLDALEPAARARSIRVCCVDLPLPPRRWLASEASDGDLVIHRSTGAAG